MKFYKFSFYKKYHKYIRKNLFELSLKLGRMNFQNSRHFNAFSLRFQKLITLLKHHANIEDNMLHIILKDTFPTKYVALLKEHKYLEKEITDIHNTFTQITNDNYDSQHNFYLEINKFIGNYLLHLDNEEQELMPFFLSHFSIEKLLQNKRNLRTKREVSEFLLDIKNGFCDCNLQEQIEFVLEIQKHESETLIKKVQETIQSTLSKKQYKILMTYVNKYI